jgi:hypothetical protein
MILKTPADSVGVFLCLMLAEKYVFWGKRVILPFYIFTSILCCKLAKSPTLIVSFYPKPVRIIPHTSVIHYSMKMF